MFIRETEGKIFSIDQSGTLQQMAVCFDNTRCYASSEPVWKDIVLSWETHCPEDHIGIATRQSCLAHCFYNQCKFEEAEEYYTRAEGHYRVLPNHPESVECLPLIQNRIEDITRRLTARALTVGN